MGSNRASRMLYKLDRVPRSKHCLQAHFIHGGDAIVCGTTTGNVCVWNAVSGELFQLLAHDGTYLKLRLLLFVADNPVGLL